ncbi:hypothetical protein RUM43_008734 [Polyplax serrata]|uniref:Uncharacterized protein n=1 Tax=Polyplax serrata TaxID=468196 RepID=A0AAN8PGG8_POLSC
MALAGLETQVGDHTAKNTPEDPFLALGWAPPGSFPTSSFQSWLVCIRSPTRNNSNLLPHLNQTSVAENVRSDQVPRSVFLPTRKKKMKSDVTPSRGSDSSLHADIKVNCLLLGPCFLTSHIVIRLWNVKKYEACTGNSTDTTREGQTLEKTSAQPSTSHSSPIVVSLKVLKPNYKLLQTQVLAGN